jgi:hypothetical protein
MEINYIILAHKNPEQLQRLIERLSAESSYFYIHIDKSVEIDPFLNPVVNFNNVFFIDNDKRENGIWGDFGIVAATLNALKQILNDKRSGYCVLLSGQDYPIKTNDDINLYFKRNIGKDFIDIFPLPSKYWSIDRITKYKFNLSGKKEDFVQIGSILESDFFTKKTFKKIYRLIKVGRFDFIFKIFKKRKYPNYIRPYGGSQWWVLTVSTVDKIIAFTTNHPDYVKYHTYSLLPDEMFFQSIVMYLMEKKNDIIIMPFLSYANWEKKNCDLPVTFTSADFEELSSQPNSKLFASKFDISNDEEILDKIDTFHSRRN